MSDTLKTDAALRPNGLRAIADGLIYGLGQGHQPDAFFVADVLRVAAGKMEELQRERNVVRGLPRTWGAEYTDTLNLLKQQRDQWRECAERLAEAFRGVPYDPFTVGSFNAQNCKNALADFRMLKEGGK